MSENPAEVRRNPCATCPYRRDCPSGVWHEAEYRVLPDFDGDVTQQALSEHGLRIFHCHLSVDRICAGWAGHRTPYEILAIRLGVALGQISPSVMDYRMDVPLFATGAEAAAHGLRDYEQPSPAAKIIQTRARHGHPVSTGDQDER